jgi:hypothetical protein
MRFYFPALLALAVAAMIEARCDQPGLRPASRLGDRMFRLLGRGAFLLWLALLAWGFWRLSWWVPLAGLVGSLAVNALVLQAGVMRSWPGLSQALAIAGLAMAVVVFFSG